MVTELSQALTLDEQAQLQERLMLLLASRVRYATQGDSSSVSQEYAQALLEGVVFALQTHLQAQGLPARALLEPPLQALYEEPLSTLQGLLDQVRALYLRACETAPVFPNRALHDTLQAIEGFLGKYDYRMFPQDSHCTLDYPLRRFAGRAAHSRLFAASLPGKRLFAAISTRCAGSRIPRSFSRSQRSADQPV